MMILLLLLLLLLLLIIIIIVIIYKYVCLFQDGSFLVRDSTTSDIQPYTLVLLYNNVVKNLRIRKSTQGRLILGDEECDNIVSYLPLVASWFGSK